MELLKIKSYIEQLLGNPKNVRSRDSDQVLMANVWSQHLKIQKYDMNKMSAAELLKMLADAQLPSYESCTRVRRKLQEKNVALRGPNYKKRKEEEVKVKEQLNQI